MKRGVTIFISHISLLNEEILEKSYQLFNYDITVRVLHEFRGFSAFSSAQLSDSIVAQGAIATVARLDAFVLTIVTSLLVVGSEKVWGHRQKLYSKVFSRFFLHCIRQADQQIRAYIDGWC